jgi:class II aldolase/adducin family protein
MNNENIQDFVDICHLIQAKGLTSSSGGNVSLRAGNGIMITPSGKSLFSLKEQDIILLHPDGSFKSQNGGVPSKEWRMHLACYQRSDINAVIHVHSSSAVAVSCFKKINYNCAIPVFTPGYGIRIGELPLLPYFTPGSMNLCNEVAKVIADRNSVLLRNHGSIAVGKNIEDALNLIEDIEEEAKLFLLLGDKGEPLSPEELLRLKPNGVTK